MIDVRGATVLVGCSKDKGPVAAEARDLYTSPLFRRARAVAERGQRWFVLSALYGLVQPAQRLAPYDFSLTRWTPEQRLAWARDLVLPELLPWLQPGGRVVMLASVKYAHHLTHLLTRAGMAVELPLRGLGIGQQLKVLGHGKEAR